MTPKQKELLDFIKKFIRENGYSPSYAEMGEAVGQKSKSGTHRLVHALITHGKIVQIRGHARAIEIVKDKPSEFSVINSPMWMEIEKTFNRHYRENTSAAETLRTLKRQFIELRGLRS